MSASPVDVAIIGGGIVGTSAAAILAGAGARVALYEREALGAGASGRNSGVVQRPFDEALVGLYEETVALYRQLEALAAGFALGGEPAGLLLLDRDPAVVGAIAKDLRTRFPDLDVEVVGMAAMRELEPALAPGLVACRVGIGFPVPPAAATYAWATLAERRSVRIVLGREVRPAIERGRVAGVERDGHLEAAGAVLVAAGPWTPALVDPTGRWRPIRPLWGVVVETILDGAPRHVLEEAVMDEALGTGDAIAAGSADAPTRAAAGPAPGPAAARTGAATGAATGGPPGAATGAARTTTGVPGPTDHPEFSLVTAAGVSVVGSTFLGGDAEPPLDAWAVRILERAVAFVPAIADAPIRGVRACARPLSADGRPLLGAVPGTAGLFVAAGHGPWGISTGPGSARLVADAILGRPAAIPAALDVARFGPPAG